MEHPHNIMMDIRPEQECLAGTLLVGDSNARGHNNIGIKIRLNKIPSAIKITPEGNILLTQFHDAEYVLLRVWKGNSCTGVVSMNAFGTTVRGYRANSFGYNFDYYKVDQYLPLCNKAILCLVSRHFCNLLGDVYFNRPCDISILSVGDEALKSNWRGHRVREYSDLANLPVPKISASHHRHFTAQEAYRVLGTKVNDRVEVLQTFPETHDSMMASLLIWAAGVKDNLYLIIKKSKLFFAPDIKAFIKEAKRISVLAKSLQNLVEEDLRQVFELDVLTNRIEGELDWDTEKENRVNPKFAHVPAGDVYSMAVSMFREAKMRGRGPTRMKWSAYWNNRWQWSASGSVHSQYAADEAYVSCERQLKNKFITISNMPSLTSEYFLERLPSIHAWSSYKYEWGKLRAIYGTDLTSYITANYAYYNCEDVLPSYFPVGRDANDANVAARVSAILDHKTPFCVDFEDFNSQHSPESMVSVLEAYMAVFRQDVEYEQLQAMEWTMRSLRNSIIHDNMGTKTTYRANGTLLSGWRLTTFMNSVLNYIYTKTIAAETFPNKNSLHNGDDVILGVNNLEVARVCVKNALRSGIRLQRTKCAFAGIAEFLRVDHIRGSRGQYLSRACATIAHSRIESKMSTDARDLIESMESRLADCYYRGMDIKLISRLRHTYYQHQAVVCGMPVSEFYNIKTIHRCAGGVSTYPDARVDLKVLTGLNEQHHIALPKLPGIQAFADVIYDDLELEVSRRQIVERIERATYEAVMEKNRTNRTVPINDAWYITMRALYKAHRGTLSVLNYGKAALVGLSFKLLDVKAPCLALTRFLRSSSRPLEALNLVV